MASVPGKELAEDAGAAARMVAAAGHADELLNFLKRRVGCPHEAADLRQEALLRMGSATASPVRDIRAYLFQVARNLMADRSRTLRREAPGAMSEHSSHALASEAPGPDRCAEGASELAALRRAIASLPERQRLALLWTRLDGLTLRLVGERLGVSESMAGRYVTQALARCQEMLDG
jgi:RNA polymerase sigma-70 factor (ECF subfamily)